ncbi:hypothetical protein [Myxococcus landrumensis]|nr:hypothetical protein [Myxococcus landrumus]
MLRLLLMLVLVHGLVPSFGEAIEMAVHYAVSGHVAHSVEGESDLGDLSREHGCGPTSHQCGCCPSQHVTPVSLPSVAWVLDSGAQEIPGEEQRPTEVEQARLLRPPIAA